MLAACGGSGDSGDNPLDPTGRVYVRVMQDGVTIKGNQEAFYFADEPNCYNAYGMYEEDDPQASYDMIAGKIEANGPNCAWNIDEDGSGEVFRSSVQFYENGTFASGKKTYAPVDRDGNIITFN